MLSSMTALLERTRPEGQASTVARLQAEISRLGAELATLRDEKAALEALCHEDPLTELLNRRGFLRDFERALSYARRYKAPAALLLLDLDAFKPINDRYGHEAGDRALRLVAARLRDNLRASDLVGRLGGDEFAILLWQVDEPTACTKARSLEAILDATAMSVGGTAVPLRASIGVAPLGPEHDSAAAFARADNAMYARKAERRLAASPGRKAVRR